MTQSREEALRIRLLIFSGRSDPEWELSEAEATELRDRLERSSSAAADRRRDAPGLGYRGFLIQNSAGLQGIPEQFTVFDGVISESPGSGRGARNDVGEIEGWLLAQARDRGHGEVLDAFGVTQSRD